MLTSCPLSNKRGERGERYGASRRREREREREKKRNGEGKRKERDPIISFKSKSPMT